MKDFADAFDQVMREHAPTPSAGRDYTVVGWRAHAGGVVGEPIYYVDVEISGGDVDEKKY